MSDVAVDRAALDGSVVGDGLTHTLLLIKLRALCVSAVDQKPYVAAKERKQSKCRCLHLSSLANV